MSERADIVVCFYRKQDMWPSVAHGLAINERDINSVYVCNDERWDNDILQSMQRTVNGRFDCQFLWHEHEGFGAAKAINQGAARVTTPQFIHIDDDIVLRKDSVKTMLEDMEENTLLGGLCDDLSLEVREGVIDTTMQPLLREDRRKWVTEPPGRRYLTVRDCYLCCDTKAYRSLGGKDESYDGYGFIDYDFGIRWMMKYGLDSFQMGRGLAWNIGGLNQPHPWSESNEAKFKVRFKEWEEFIDKGAKCEVN